MLSIGKADNAVLVLWTLKGANVSSFGFTGMVARKTAEKVYGRRQPPHGFCPLHTRTLKDDALTIPGGAAHTHSFPLLTSGTLIRLSYGAHSHRLVSKV